MKIGLIGTGHIGAAMIENLAKTGADLAISRRNEHYSSHLSKRYKNVKVYENDAIMERADIVILALRPAVAREVIASLSFKKHQKILSVMATVGYEELQSLCSPAQSISVTIPLEHIANGGCPLPVFGEISTVEELFGHNNPIIKLEEESELNAYFSASTVLTSVMDSIASTVRWLGETTNNSKSAEIYALALSAGYLRDIPQTGEGELEKWRQRLAAPNTLNRQMLSTLEEDDIQAVMHKAHELILKRMSGNG